MDNHPVASEIAAAVATIVACRDRQRLVAALTETARLRAVLPGGPIQAHGREDVAACFHGCTHTSRLIADNVLSALHEVFPLCAPAINNLPSASNILVYMVAAFIYVLSHLLGCLTPTCP